VNGEDSVVPKILHRIRLGKDVLPPEAAYYELLWKQLHPAWDHVTWTMSNLPKLVNHDLFVMSKNTGHRSDILRLEIIHRFGGVYTDLDMVPLKPIDPLLDCEGFLGQIRPMPRELCIQRVETAIIGSAPGNPFIKQLISDMPQWALAHADSDTSVRTGPQYIQSQIDRLQGPIPMTLYPPDHFYPYLWNETHRWLEPFPESYAVHRWWGSWRVHSQSVTQPPADTDAVLR
jgi:mannosyltransferase OCH1-like enzyme